MEFAPGVHQIETRLGPRVSCLYLFTGPAGTVLFDTGIDGTSTRDVLPYLKRIGLGARDVTHIVVSHCDVDHSGGLADAAGLFVAAETCAHELDAAAIEDYSVYEAARAREFVEPYGWDEDPAVLEWTREVTREAPVQRRLRGGEHLDLGDRQLEILHVPGHSRGHLAISDPGNGLVAISDAVLGDAVLNADGSPAFPPTYRYVADYLSTIDRLAQLDPDLLLTAHYPAYRGVAVQNFLALSRSFVAGLDDALAAVLARAVTPLTLTQILHLLNGQVGRWPVEGTAGALAFPVTGHLEHQLAQRRVSAARTDGTTTFSPS